jgi:serralysin
MAVFASTQTLANYLIKGYYADAPGDAYRIDTSRSNVVTVNLTGLTADSQKVARAALAAYEAVADLDFQEVRSGGRITFTDNPSIVIGRTSYSGPITKIVPNGSFLKSAQVNIPLSSQERYGTNGDPGGIGTYNLQLFLHEIGHALGLGHLGTYQPNASFGSAKFTTDSWMTSAMSYFNQSENDFFSKNYGVILTPMMADIMAVQMLYGRQTGGPTAGNTVYGLGSDLGTYLDLAFRNSGGTSKVGGTLKEDYLTIYDAGGIDSFNFSNDTAAQRFTLEGGTFNSVYGRVANVAIAVGTVIENFSAGSGSDTITGNSAANHLNLGAGSDKSHGKGGNDRLSGANGHDSLNGNDGNDTLLGGTGDDQLYGGDGVDRLSGEVEDDLLFGGNGDDFLFGGDGVDRLNSGAGRDSLYGHAGADSLLGGIGSDRLEGGIGNDSLRGEADNDHLRGGDGNDSLNGGAGNDSLDGGSGADRFVIQSGVDTIAQFQNNLDTLALDDALWGGGRTVAQVLGLATVTRSGDISFNFNGEHALVIKGMTDIAALLDDLAIL